MSTHKNFDAICILVLAICLLITVLFMNGSRLGIEMVIDEDAEAHAGDVYFTSNDMNGSWSTNSATVIILNGDSAKVSGSGAYFYKGDLFISNGGKYLLQGELIDGSIIIDAYASSKVWLMLDGVSINCTDDAALRINQADKVFITLAEGSDNSLVSGTEYSAEALADNAGGTIYAHDDLTINGSGKLTVLSPGKHGIDANDELVITGGVISIEAAEDAIHANEGVRLQGMELTVTAGDDGIHCDTGIVIAGGTIFMPSCYEGIEAKTIEIWDGEITIYPEDDGFNANGSSRSFDFGGMFGGGMFRPGGFNENGAESQSAIPDATGGTPPGSSELQTEVTEEEETWLHIAGGTITIINDSARDADGLDSNGDITITGGTIRISLTDNGSNSALDCGSENGGVMEISGGSVVACGSYSMAEGFDSSSLQCSVLYNISAGVDAGTEITLEDMSGNNLLSYTAPCSFSSVVLSCPEMQLGDTYVLHFGEDSEEITLSEVSASFGDAQSTMFGGPMNWGGMQHGRDGHRRNFDGEMPNSEGMPIPPDFDGEMPDFSNMPQPPDFAGELPASDSQLQSPASETETE